MHKCIIFTLWDPDQMLLSTTTHVEYSFYTYNKCTCYGVHLFTTNLRVQGQHLSCEMSELQAVTHITEASKVSIVHPLMDIDRLTCRSVLSSSVASFCFPSFAITIISWIIPMRRWYGGGGPPRPNLSPPDLSTNEAKISPRCLVGVRFDPGSDPAPLVCLVPMGVS